MAKYLIDTCLLVYVARGREEKVRGLESLRGAAISYVTYGELVQGVRNKQDLKMVEECQSLSLVYRRRGWFKNFLVNSNGGTFPMLVWSLS